MVYDKNIALAPVAYPQIGEPKNRPELSDAVYGARLERVLRMMRENKFDHMVFYADREHYSNFEYITGFDPRFEEALLVLNADGGATCLLGNECEPLGALCRIPAKTVLYQALSLPSQPIDRLRPLEELLQEAGIAAGGKVGVVGWKLMYPRYARKRCFDVSAYIIAALDAVAGPENVENATDRMIDPAYGIRIINTADDIAYFEYGAAMSGEALKELLDGLKTGVSEIEISRLSRIGGLPLNSYSLSTVGANNDTGLVSPSDAVLTLGERYNASVGLRGGLSCRTGYIAYNADDLPEGSRDYFNVLVAPYYAAVVNWYEHMKIGASAGDIFNVISTVLPKEEYHWKLNPGHFVACEEWLSSPFCRDSKTTIQSGMCIQMDIIPSLGSKYAGANCEDGVAIADAKLREEIQNRFPEVWKRIEIRRAHMKNVLGIDLPDEVLPLSNLAATYRPFMLNKDLALVVNR